LYGRGHSFDVFFICKDESSSVCNYRRQNACSSEIGKRVVILASGNIDLYHISFEALGVFLLEFPVISFVLRDMKEFPLARATNFSVCGS
jgi:hypothetical protein